MAERAEAHEDLAAQKRDALPGALAACIVAGGGAALMLNDGRIAVWIAALAAALALDWRVHDRLALSPDARACAILSISATFLVSAIASSLPAALWLHGGMGPALMAGALWLAGGLVSLSQAGHDHKRIAAAIAPWLLSMIAMPIAHAYLTAQNDLLLMALALVAAFACALGGAHAAAWRAKGEAPIAPVPTATIAPLVEHAPPAPERRLAEVIPFPAPAPRASGAVSPGIGAGLSALVVDDDADARALARAALETLGFHVETASLRGARAGCAPHADYALVLCDPGGEPDWAELRAFAARAPLALSGSHALRSLGRAPGIGAVLIKPLTPNMVAEAAILLSAPPARPKRLEVSSLNLIVSAHA